MEPHALDHFRFLCVLDRDLRVIMRILSMARKSMELCALDHFRFLISRFMSLIEI